MFCLDSPELLASDIIAQISNPEDIQLTDINMVEDIIVKELQKSQADWPTLTPENRAKRADIVPMEEFLQRFEEALRLELPYAFDRDDTSLHSNILQQVLTEDWQTKIKDDFTAFLSSNQEPNIDLDIPASDETIEQLIAQDLDESQLIEVDDYTEYLLTLAKTYLSSSASSHLNIMPYSSLAAGLAKFIDSSMFLAMIDTRDSEEGGGFSYDKEVIAAKLKKYTAGIISTNSALLSDDIFNNDLSIASPAVTTLYANILNKHIDGISERAFQENNYDHVISFDHTNISSDIYLDRLSTMVMNNTPRLVQDTNSINSFTIDAANPTLSAKEIKNIVAPVFATLESNTIEQVRAAMHTSSNPVIQSIYHYYFSNDPNGFILTDQSGQRSTRYSVAYAVEQAYKSKFSEEGGDVKFASFNTDDTGLFKNRLIQTFTSIQSADRVSVNNGQIKFASDAANNTESAYINNIEHRITSNTASNININPNISNRISFTQTGDGNLNLIINKVNPVTKKIETLISVDVALETQDITLDKLKGRLVSIVKTRGNEVYNDRNSQEHKNLLEALNSLGFSWTNKVFLDEYYKNNSADSNNSLLNLLGNLAMINTLNDDTLRASLEVAVPGISDLTGGTMVDDEIDDGLRFNIPSYLYEFFGKDGAVTAAIGAVYNYNNIFNFKSQEGEHAAATVAPTLVATKQKVINKARKRLGKGLFSSLDGNWFVGEVNDINDVSKPIYKITKRAVKEGIDQYGNTYLLQDMTAADRVAALITMGVASMVDYKSNLNTVILQPHQYADKKTIDIFEIETLDGQPLIPVIDGKIDIATLRTQAANSYQQQIGALQRTIVKDWEKFFAIPAAVEFSRKADKVEVANLIAQFQNNPPQTLQKLNEFLKAIDLDPAFVVKSTDLLEHRTFNIKNEQVIVKDSLLKLENILTKYPEDFVDYNNSNFLESFKSSFGDNIYAVDPDLRGTLGFKLGLNSTPTSYEVAEVYHLLHQALASQLEALTMGHFSQFGGNENIKIDFSKVKNDFETEEEFQKYRQFLELETMLSPQEKAKSKRTSQISTNGIKLAILGKDEYGPGVKETFHYVTIEDPKLAKKLITQNVDGFDSHDGIRISLDIVRLQVNASLGGDAAMSSKGESRKDSQASFNDEDGAYGLQKMSTMYLTPEFIRNSPEAHDIIKRMLTAVPYPDEAQVFTEQGQGVFAANAWELLMSLQNADPTLTLDNPALWSKFQEIESLSPEIRGEYVSYVVLKTVEKTGSKGIEDSTTLYGHKSDYKKGDKVQWARQGDGLIYTAGTVTDVVQDNDEEVIAVEEELAALRQQLVKEVVMAAPTEQKFINVSSDKITKLNEGRFVSVSRAPGVKLTDGINKLPDGSLVNVTVVNIPKIGQLSNPELWAQMEGYPSLQAMKDGIVSPEIRKFLDGIAGLTIYKLRKHVSKVNNNPYMGIITKLQPHQVFVFGANAVGLHGLGAAASAMGQKRSLSDIQKVKDGTVGKWAIKGETGLMRGYDGTSYGLVTVEYPGHNKADTRLPEATITANIQQLYKLANDNPELEYLVAYNNALDKKSLNGYTGAEMIAMFNAAGEIPTNMRFSQEWTATGLLNFIKNTNAEAQKPKSIEDFHLISGKAKGADTVFAKVGKDFGLIKVTDYTVNGYSNLTPNLKRQADEAYEKAAVALGRPVLSDEKYPGQLMRRNYLQVIAADAVFAVSDIINSYKKGPKGFENKTNKQVVEGGTGVTVEMAIQLKKPVYVFDQSTNKWNAWDPIGNVFTPLDKTPTLTPMFAGVGSSTNLTSAGEAAIADLYQTTISELETPTPTTLYDINIAEVIPESIPSPAASTEAASTKTSESIKQIQDIIEELTLDIEGDSMALGIAQTETTGELLENNPMMVILEFMKKTTFSRADIKKTTGFDVGKDIKSQWAWSRNEEANPPHNAIKMPGFADGLFMEYFNPDLALEGVNYIPGMESTDDVLTAMTDIMQRTEAEVLREINQTDKKLELKDKIRDNKKRLQQAQKGLDDALKVEVKYTSEVYVVDANDKIYKAKSKSVTLKEGSSHYNTVLERAEDIRQTKLENVIKELGFAKPTKEDLEGNEFDMPRAVIASTDVAKRIAELEDRLNLLKEASDGTIIQVVKPSESDPYGYNKINLRLNVDGSMLEIDPESKQETPLQEIVKSFNYKTGNYNNYSVVLNAGKDAEYKGGVAKMTQAFNSVLFNNEYVNDALNMVKAQGTMATSNLNKLKEEFTILTINAIIDIDTIAGVLPSELSRIKELFEKLLEQPAAYNRNKNEIEIFLGRSEVQKLGYKAFVVEQAKKKNLDPDLFMEIKKSNYSFSGATTNLMFQVFSTAVEQATVKARFAGQNFILAPGGNLLKTYEYKGTKMLRGALIKELINDNINESLKNVDDSLKEVFLEGLDLQPHDVIIKNNSEVLAVQSLLDANVHITGDINSNAYLVNLLSDPNENYTYLRLNDYKESTLAAPEILTQEGNDILDTIEYTSYMFFKNGESRKEPLSEDVFNIYKALSNTLPHAEYDFFRQYKTYTEYLADPTRETVALNPILTSKLAIDRFLLELQQNTYIVNGKAFLQAPVQLDIFDPNGEISDILDLLTHEQLGPVISYLENLNLDVVSAFNLQNVNSPEESNTHASIQENVLNLIDLREVAEINQGVEIPTPFKSAQAALIAELQSTVANEPKYKTTKGEIVIPFVYAKEFGFSDGELPTIQEVIGVAKSREQAVINAKDYFYSFKKRGINFPRLHDALVEGFPGESDISLFERNIEQYRLILAEELVLANASTGVGAGNLKAELIESVLIYLDNIEFKEDTQVGSIVNTINRRLIEQSSYGNFVRNNRAESFVNYLEVFYGRIPGTGLQSNGVGHTVGFVQDMGNTAFVHDQNGMISGSDFDIDKITTILRAIDDNGVAYSYDEWLDVDSQTYTIAEEFAKDPQSITLENLQSMANAITSENFEARLTELADKYEASLFSTNKFRGEKRDVKTVMRKSLQFKTRYRQNFEKAMQNYILDQLKTITQAANIQFEAQTIVTTDTLKDAKNTLVNKRLSVALTTEQKNKINTLISPFNLMSQMKLEEENRVGEISIGMFANAQKILANIQHGVNALKKEGYLSAGKFKTPLSIIIDRPNEVVQRTSLAVANTQETGINTEGTVASGFKSIISSHEDAVVKKVINDIRATDENLTITDIFRIVQDNNEDLSKQYAVEDLASIWSRKMMHLASTKGWEAIGQFIQASTDNAKVLLLGPIGANLTTNSYFSTLLIGGFNIYDTVEFLSNPKVSAASLIYEHFKKEAFTGFNLKTIFGDNIPMEYQNVFKSIDGVINQLPAGLSLSMSEFIEKLQRATPEQDNIYASMSSVIKAEEEVQVMNSIVGLDVSQPNSLIDTINKMRTIGGAMLKILKRGPNKYKDAGPVQLAYDYMTDSETRVSIDRDFKAKTNFINALEIINTHPFKIYLNTLGDKIKMTKELSYIPEVYMQSKFSGFKSPTYRESKDVENILYGFGVQTYISDISSEAKSLTLNNGETYDLSDSKQQVKFLENFLQDSHALSLKYKSALFDVLKYDSDLSYDTDTPKRSKYLGLLINQNTMADELAFIKIAIEEMKMPSADPELKNFYTNLKYYTLLTEKGLASKSGIFQFIQNDLTGYNEYLGTIVENEQILAKLKGINTVSVQLNAPHLMPIVDTSKMPISRTEATEDLQAEYDIQIEEARDEERKIEEEYEMLNQAEEGPGVSYVKRKTVYDLERIIDQKADLYQSKHSKRVYRHIPFIGHVAVSPIETRKGRPVDHNEPDPVKAAGWQYGIPVHYQGKTIYLLRPSKTDVNNYSYVESSNELAALLVQEQKADPNDETDFQDAILAETKLISATQLLTHNPEWVFRGPVFRKRTVGENKNKYFKSLNNTTFIPNREDGGVKVDPAIITKIENTKNSLKGRYQADLDNLKKSNKAIISGRIEDFAMYIDAIIEQKQVNPKTFKQSDVVTVISESGTISESIRKAVEAGATILTLSTMNRTPAENKIARYLTGKDYIDVDKQGVWIKNTQIRAQKMSSIPTDPSYRNSATRISKKMFSGVIAQIARLFPNIDVQALSSQEIILEFGEAYAKYKGFVKDGVVYFNTDNMTLDTVYHEFGHIYMSWLKQNDINMYNYMVQEAFEHESAVSIAARYPELEGNDLGEEIFVELLGLEAAQFDAKPTFAKGIAKAKQWLQEMFRRLFNRPDLGINDQDTIHELIEKVGRSFVFGSEMMQNITSDDIALWDAGLRPSMSYAMIENNLIEQGFIKKMCNN